MLAACGGGAVCGERAVGCPLGDVACRDGKCQRAASGRQEPLTAGAACVVVVGADCQGGRFDLGGDRAATVAGSRGAHHRQLARSVLQASQGELQKKLCTRPSKSGPTWPRRGNAGKPARHSLMPSAWYSSMRLEPRPRWSARVDVVAAAGG